MSIVLSINAEEIGHAQDSCRSRWAFSLGRRGLRFVAKRVEHDATVCNEGTHRDAHFLPYQLSERIRVHLERDHLQFGFPVCVTFSARI